MIHIIKEMVRFNGKEFQLYDLDTQISALNRLASELDTIPIYLYFPNGIPTIEQLQERDNIIVEDLLPVIINTKFEFGDLYKQIKDKISDLNLFVDVLVPFIAFNQTINEIPVEYQGIIFKQIEDEITKTKLFLNEKINIEELWKDREQVKQYIENTIKSIKKQSINEVKVVNEFEIITKGLDYTEFELEKVSFNIILNLKDISLLEIFNNIRLNTNVPFATLNNFYKILKDFSPSPDWSISLESGIIFKILEKINTKNPKLIDYTDAYISVEGEQGKEIVTAMLDLSTSGSNLSREDFVSRFLGTLTSIGDISIENTKESQVNGVFYFPSHSMNNYVFSDMVMNNPLFSSLISIDESDKATKKKPSIYIHFNHPLIGYVTANITEKIMDKIDPSMKKKSSLTFPLNERYIRVKISKADNVEAVRKFQIMLSKLFVIYDNNYDQIVQYYRKFIPSFGEIISFEIPPPRKEALKHLEPEIFLPGYTRQCPRVPTIVNDQDADKARKDGQQVMIFPTQGEGPQQRNYICNHLEHKYPGLRANPLSNNKKFPFVPCCYAKDQESREGSKYRHYYYGEDIPQKENIQQDLFTTNKFVPNNIFGTLPQNITEMFEIIEPNEQYTFVRKGVFRSKSSFLNCVMEALNDQTNILQIEDEYEREERIVQIRKSLATPEKASTCRQEMYDFTTEEIIKAIQDQTVYLDPKLFLHLLEIEYNCNIFIFTRNNIKGEMSLPRHQQAYYKTKRTGKCIFIFEHIGSEKDRAEFPQCELIIKWGIKNVDDIQYDFNYDSSISTGVKEVFETLRKSYALNKSNPEDHFPWTGDSIITSQIIDSYGKLRKLNVNFKGEDFSLITTPLQPGLILETNDKTIKKLALDTAIQFAANIKMIITKQSVFDGVVKELSGKIGNVNVIIPINYGSPIKGVPTVEGHINYSDSHMSVIEQYNKNKKIARYVSEYLFWLFSKYLQNNNISTILPQTIIDFQQKMILVNPDFEYQYIPKTFSTTKNGLMSGGKLILKSEETLRRLLYVLRLTAIRFPLKLITYHTRNFIEQYYIDITDFDQHPFQVVLEGDESVEKWIQEKKIKYTLRNDVPIGVLTPYFFRNTLISDDVYLAQNTDSMLKAITIATTWFTKRFNQGSDVEESERVAFTLYSYVSSDDIIIYKISGDETPFDIRMLGYKIEDQSFFTVLLPLK